MLATGADVGAIADLGADTIRSVGDENGQSKCPAQPNRSGRLALVVLQELAEALLTANLRERQHVSRRDQRTGENISRLLTTRYESSKRVPIVFDTERDSNSATAYAASSYDNRKREYCYEEGSFRGGAGL